MHFLCDHTNSEPFCQMDLLSDADYEVCLAALEDTEKAFLVTNCCEQRFQTFSTENDIKDEIKNAVPKSTQSKEKWAITIFQNYNSARNQFILSSGSDELMVLNLVDEMSKGDIQFLLPKFINDVRKKDGSKYPGETMRQMVCSIFHYFRYQKDQSWDFFKDEEFDVSRKTLDACMKARTKEGIGLYKRKAAYISHEIEEKLWDDGHLGVKTPKQLLYTVVYLFGLHFGLRARKEHRQLRTGYNSQLKIVVDPISGSNILRYTEDCEKTRNGGLRDRNISPKIIDVYENDNERNIVKIYKKYVSVRPQGNNCHNFYLQPLSEPKGNIWYKDQPMGENALGEVIKKLFANANIEGHFTNHSLRRSKVTRLFQAGHEKENIKNQTGHKSDDGIMAYREFSDNEKRSFQMSIEKSTGECSLPSVINKQKPCDSKNEASISIEIRNGDKVISIKL